MSFSGIPRPKPLFGAASEIGPKLKLRKHSPDLTTKCTREEDINVNDFLIEDFRYLNEEERKLQNELLGLHKDTFVR